MDTGTFCQAGKATVTITYGNEQKQIFKTEETPIAVNHTEIANAPEEYCNGKQCYRFYALTGGNVTFEHYVMAYSANYKPDPSLMNNGAWLIADKQVLNGTSYYYWQGTFGNAPDQVTYNRGLEIIPQVGTRQGSSSGDCNCSACKIEIKNKNQTIIYNKTVVSPCDIKVDCGDCPDGYIRCACNEYPGYCCISCSEIKSEIASLRGAIKR